MATAAHQTNNTILAEDAMAEAGRKIFAVQLDKMLSHEDGSRTGEDIESVHQMRVATRRMRSLLKLIGDDTYKSKTVKKYSRGLRDIARALGEIRDLDVLIVDLEDFHQTLPENEKAILDSIIAKIDKRRSKYRQKLNDHFDSKSYRKFVSKFATFTLKSGKGAVSVDSKEIPHQVRHVLPVLLHERLSAVRAYDTVIDGADDETLHSLRVEFKQLRYAVEFFKPVLGASASKFIKEIKAMQDLLGRMNDVVVFTEYMNSIKKLSPEQETVVEHYTTVRENELDILREQFDEQWQSFNTRTTQRQLSDALLVLR